MFISNDLKKKKNQLMIYVCTVGRFSKDAIYVQVLSGHRFST